MGRSPQSITSPWGFVEVALLTFAPVAWGGEPCTSPATYEWVAQFGSDDHDLGRDLAVDDEGNAYLTGWTRGTFPGQSSAGGWDVFLAKYSPAGVAYWAIQFGVSQDDRGIGVTTDGQSNVYISGTTHGEFPGQAFTGGTTDAFVINLTADGEQTEQTWVHQFGAGNSDQGYRVVTDPLGNVYVSGSTLGIFPGEVGTGADERDPFLAKFTAAGEQRWIRQLSEKGSAPALAVDHHGYVYIGGYTTGKFPGQQSSGDVNAFIIRYSPDGEELWIHQFGSDAATIGTDLAVDGEGNAYIVGHTIGAIHEQDETFGERDAFVAKYTPDGTQQWLKQFGASDDDKAYGVDVDQNGIVYVGGHTHGAFPGETHAGASDVFIARLTTDGQLLSVRQFGTAQDDIARTLCVDQSGGGVYVAGQTLGTFPGQQSGGGFDSFLVRWNDCVPDVPGDLNGDGVVNVDDLLILLNNWGSCDDCEDCIADITGNCTVNVDDLLILLNNWGSARE